MGRNTRKLLVWLALVAVAASALAGCASEAADAPRFVWVLQDGTATLDLARVDLLYSTGPVRATWEFAARNDGRSRFTVVVAAPTNPNWKAFEVRDGGALVNHLVRPEEDYLKTGGDPQTVSQVRSVVSANLGEGVAARYRLYFVTFDYPSELGVQRQPGALTVTHLISPWHVQGLICHYVMGWNPGQGDDGAQVDVRSDNPLSGMRARQAEAPSGGLAIRAQLAPSSLAIALVLGALGAMVVAGSAMVRGRLK